MQYALFICLGGLLLGCTTAELQQPSSSAACLQYRGMMTAPLPPEQMQQLKAACDASLKVTE